MTTEWREVCRWDEGPTPPAFEGLKIDWRKVALSTLESEADLKRLCESLAAAFEELAGEHRALQAILAEGIWVGDSVEKVVMPNPSEDQVSVRPYVRAKPRRSKLVETEPDQGTVQPDPSPCQIDPFQAHTEGSDGLTEVGRISVENGPEVFEERSGG